jgi:hypothetical protein
MRTPLFIILGMVLVLAGGGCGKKAVPLATVTPPVDAASQPASPAPQPAQANMAAQASESASALAQPGGQVDMAELQRWVVRWVVAHHHKPASFEEFAASAGVTIPPPPVGKKYILQKDLHVVLANR